VSGQRIQVRQFLLVEAHRCGECVQNPAARIVLASLLEADVVVDAYPGQCGEFLAAQARRAAQARSLREADVGGADPGPPGLQELAQLVAVAHRAILA